MTKTFSFIVFMLGALVVIWMGSSFIHSNGLALLVTVLIAAAYLAGFVELLRYQQATESLLGALASVTEPVEDLGRWLQSLNPSLRFEVRQRIYGESAGLPAPLLTPYLVGLLVMLGLLGTFIGMVETLQGAVGALQGTTELEAVRKGLAAPIEGLGMAFATSVAGVTASAMLGLISTISRKQRLQASRQLDGEMAGVFKQHSLSFQRRQTYEVLQAQSAVMPRVAEQLSTLATQLDARMQTLAESLGQSQQSLQQGLVNQYQALSQSVESALSKGFQDTGRLAAESAQPVLKAFTESLEKESKSTQRHIAAAVEQQLSAVNKQLDQSSEKLHSAWQLAQQSQREVNEQFLGQIGERLTSVQAELSQGAQAMMSGLRESHGAWLDQLQESEQTRLKQWREQFELSARSLQEASAELGDRARQNAADSQNEIAKVLAQGQTLMNSLQEHENRWQEEGAARLQNLTDTVSAQLQALRTEEQARGEAAVERLAELQEASARQLAALGEALEQPMARLIDTASDAPKAAAEVIEQLRGEISKNIERDNSLLEERQHTLSQLNALSASLEENARLQREAVQALLEGSSEHLQGVGESFTERVNTESHSLVEQMAHFSASTAELAVLGEVFTGAVKQFGEANQQLMARLEHIEKVLLDAGKRSDEQMEYYLGQAREIIDHNLVSHQELLGHVRELNGTQG